MSASTQMIPARDSCLLFSRHDAALPAQPLAAWFRCSMEPTGRTAQSEPTRVLREGSEDRLRDISARCLSTIRRAAE
jgi:hypothetical protein